MIPKRWVPVFGKDHAPALSRDEIRKKSFGATHFCRIFSQIGCDPQPTTGNHRGPVRIGERCLISQTAMPRPGHISGATMAGLKRGRMAWGRLISVRRVGSGEDRV